MQASGRTAGPTRGWMGAHAPITTLRPEANPPAGYAVFILLIPSRDPSRLLRPLVRLVAAGDERVQKAQASESAVDFRLDRLSFRARRPRCGRTMKLIWSALHCSRCPPS